MCRVSVRIFNVPVLRYGVCTVNACLGGMDVIDIGDIILV